MKKIYLLIISLLVYFVVIINTSFITRNKEVSSSLTKKISDTYNSKLDRFGEEIKAFIDEVESFDGSPNAVELLQHKFLNLRLTYKEFEFLISYLDPEFVDDYINGPPLPSLERNAPSLSIIQPEGLQVIEELVFSEDPSKEKDEISILTKLLLENFSSHAEFQKRVFLSDRHVFEATRMNLIRIFSLGISGFDSPVAQNSLPEAAVSLEATYASLMHYFPMIQKINPSLKDELDNKFLEGIQYLKDHNGFNDFDRLYFLKQFINPLFKLTLRAHLALGIETIYESTPSNQKHPVNYYSENLFDNNFLNPFYYTDIQKENYRKEVVDLGRMLFFDPVLSSNNQRSCASCHNPEKAFSDGFAKSKAFDHKGTLNRNAPTLINSIYADRYFYDLRADVLENQIEHVLVDKKEFHSSYIEVFKKLNKSEEYVEKFKKAFPEIASSEPIMKHTLSAALSAYVISLSGFNSPFDKYVRGETAHLDAMAVSGFNLFMGKAGCGTCHFAPVFNGLVPPLYKESESEVLGVPAFAKVDHFEIDPDPGRYKGVLKEEAPIYKHSFKTTTVRNAELTAPYMHNGVFETLEEVIDFYNNGGGIGLGMEVSNQTLPSAPLDLNDLEKKQLIAFMRSLTDTTGMAIKPNKLPYFTDNNLNNRVIGGTY